MSADKITIGLTPESRKVMARLTERDWFETQIDAAKFAMAFAITRNVAPGSPDKAETVWNTGSFDDDGTLRTIVPALYPGTEHPYKLVEHFINAGLTLIDQELSMGGNLSLTQLMERANPKQETLL